MSSGASQRRSTRRRATSSGTAATPAPGAIGVEQKPAVYLVWWGAEWAGAGFQTADTDGKLYSSQDAADLPVVVLPEPRRQPLGEHPDAVLQHPPPRLDDLRRRHRLRHEPEAAAEGRLDRSDAGARRHRHARPRREPRRRPDRAEAMRASAHFGYDPQATYIILTPPRPIATGQPVYCGYHSQTAIDRRARQPVPHPVRVHPLAEHELAGRRHDRLRHALRQRDDRTRSATASSTAGRSSPATSTPRPSPTRTTSRRGRTAGSTRRAARTATSARGLRTRRTSRSAAHQFAVQPMWSNEAFDATGNGCVLGEIRETTMRKVHPGSRAARGRRPPSFRASRPPRADHRPRSRARRRARRSRPGTTRYLAVAGTASFATPAAGDDALLPPPRRLRHRERQPAPERHLRHRRRRRLRARPQLGRRARRRRRPGRVRRLPGVRRDAARARREPSRSTATIDITGDARSALVEVDVEPGGARRRPGRRRRLATARRVLDPTASDNPVAFTIQPERVARRRRPAGARPARAHPRAERRQRVRRHCRASRGSTCRPTRRASNQSVEVSVDDPTFANAGPGAPRPARRWSVAVPTPAVGTHTIYARSTQGFDTGAAASQPFTVTK